MKVRVFRFEETVSPSLIQEFLRGDSLATGELWGRASERSRLESVVTDGQLAR